MRHSLGLFSSVAPQTVAGLRLPRLDSVLGSSRTRRPLCPRLEAIRIWLYGEWRCMCRHIYWASVALIGSSAVPLAGYDLPLSRRRLLHAHLSALHKVRWTPTTAVMPWTMAAWLGGHIRLNSGRRVPLSSISAIDFGCLSVSHLSYLDQYPLRETHRQSWKRLRPWPWASEVLSVEGTRQCSHHAINDAY
jgi:hypothetical protein